MSLHEEHRLARARRWWVGARITGERGFPNPLALICQPSPPAKPFPYGDGSARVPASGRQRRHFPHLVRPAFSGSPAARQAAGLLWSYHSDTLVTCIDSALVLQGFRDPASIPFYSAVTIPRGRILGVLARLSLGRSEGSSSGSGTKSTGLIVRRRTPHDKQRPRVALTQPGSPHRARRSLDRCSDENCHPRCRCADHMEYIAGYALPPYVVG